MLIKKVKWRVAISLALLLCQSVLWAQSKLLQGKVQDENGAPLEKVTVKAAPDNSKLPITTTTTADGNFSFTELKQGVKYTLQFSYVGFESQSIEWNADNSQSSHSLTVTMKQKENSLGEAVVIGYGTQSRGKITGAVSRIGADQFKDMPITNFQQGIAGRVPGVQVISATGEPGGGIMMRIRGVGSITAGTQPLIVLDGLPLSSSNLSTLNTGEIESVEVLKDAAASAIYGSRGANGVVLITTKKGSGKPQYRLNSYYGVQSVTKEINLMDAYERARFIAEARNNYWVDLNPTVNQPSDPNSVRPASGKIPEYLLPYLLGQTGLPNTDWQDAIFQNAPIQNYELSASGSKDGFRYFIAGNYFDQKGVVLNSGFKRYSLRTNFEAKLHPRITLNINLNPSFSRYKIISQGGHKNNGIVLNAMIADPALPLYDSSGGYAISRQIVEGGIYGLGQPENPAALAALTDDIQEDLKLLGGLSLSYNIIKGLTFKTYLGGNIISSGEDFYKPTTLGDWAVSAPAQARAFTKAFRSWNWITENTLNYALNINKDHSITVLAGYTAQKENVKNSVLNAINFPNDVVQTLNAGQVTGGSSDISEWALTSYLGRATYDYKNKYLLTASLRRDGSSRFGKNTKWGWFPSVSAGWRISEESFFPQRSFISDLKLRGSYGKTGNFQIPDYGAVGLLNRTNYIFGNTNTNGQSPATLPNPDLSWEKTNQVNAGIDIGLWKNKVYLTADYYSSETDGLLLDVPVPASAGVSISLQNYGRVRNSGFELGITSHHTFSNKLEWTASFNVSRNQNEVLELGPGQTQILNTTHLTRVGDEIGAYYGYKVLGVFADQNNLNSYPHLSTSKPGSYIYADLNDDKAINDKDRTILGSFFPEFTYGFSSNFKYKGFDAAFLLQGVQGIEIYNQAKVFYYSSEGWSNTSKDLNSGYYKSPSDPGTGVARPNAKPTDKLFENSDFLIEDGSYLRFRNITLGYTLPDKLMRRASISKFRIYVSANNPFTFTDYSGYNPEVSTNGSLLTPGVDYGAYPLNKSVIFGINLNF